MAREKQQQRSLAGLREWIATFPRRGIELAASLAVLLATAAAVILALHIVFVVFKTNPNNGIVEFVNGLADGLAWEFKNLFLGSKRTEVVVNFGLAAVFYLVVGRLVAGLLRRLG